MVQTRRAMPVGKVEMRMTDEKLISLLWTRDESVLGAVEEQYGRLCRTVAGRILPDARDVEECVQDSCLKLWNAIPPERPRSLRAYLMRLCRNTALDRYHRETAEKRSTALTTAYEELEFTLFDGRAEQTVDALALREVLNRFLRQRSPQARGWFLRYYWYGESIPEIAASCGEKEAKVKTAIYRLRRDLREVLEEEGVLE